MLSMFETVAFSKASKTNVQFRIVKKALEKPAVGEKTTVWTKTIKPVKVTKKS